MCNLMNLILMLHVMVGIVYLEMVHLILLRYMEWRVFSLNSCNRRVRIFRGLRWPSQFLPRIKQRTGFPMLISGVIGMCFVHL
jgi:hypothetical protein